MKNLFLALSIVAAIPGQALAAAPKQSWSEKAYGGISVVTGLIGFILLAAGNNKYKDSYFETELAKKTRIYTNILSIPFLGVALISGYLAHRQAKERAEELHLK